MNHVLYPRIVGITGRRNAILPADIINELFLIPRMIVEGRIRKDKVCFQCGVQIVGKGVRLIGSEIRINTTDSHIHFSHFPCIRISLLTVNCNGTSLTGMCLNELCTLHEHTAAPAAAIVHTAVIKGTQDGNEGFYNT